MMNVKPLTRTLAMILAGGVAVLSSSVQADVSVMPVADAEATSEISGIVEIVNVEKRMLTIKTADGRFEVIHVPVEVERLDKVKIGNRLTITETEAVLIDLVKGPGAGAVGTTQETVVDREKGAKSAGSITDTLTLYGRIEGVDKAKGKVKVKGEEQTVELNVKNPAILNELAVGDGVVATFVREIKGKVEFR